MKTMILAALLGGGAMFAAAAPAQAAGCLSGAVVGGVAGHVAHHGLLGAAAGCAVGHHMAVERDRRSEYRGDPDRGYQREQTYRGPGPERETYGRDAYRDGEQRR